MTDNSKQGFPRNHADCPISALVSGDPNTLLEDRIAQLVYPNFLGETIYDRTTNKQKRRKPMITIKSKIGKKKKDYEDEEYTGDSWWHIMSSIEHSGGHWSALEEADDEPVNIVFCMFRVKKIECEDITKALIPLMVVTMTRKEFYASNRFYTKQLKVNIQLSLEVVLGFTRNIFLPPSVRDKQIVPDEHPYLKSLQGLGYLLTECPKKTMWTALECIPIWDAIIIFKCYAFAAYRQKGDSDHINFMVFRMANYRELYPHPENCPNCPIGLIGDNDMVSLKFHQPKYNDEEFYKDFWRFIRYIRWCLVWHDWLASEKQRNLGDIIQNISWLNYKVFDVIVEILTEVEKKEYKSMEFLDDCHEECEHCRENAKLLSERQADKMKSIANQYDFLPFFRDTIGIRASVDAEIITRHKLCRYNPAVVSWSPTADINGRKGAIMRGNAEVLKKKAVMDELHAKWKKESLNKVDQPEPTLTTLSDLVQSLSPIETCVPIIGKWVNKHSLGVIKTERAHWISTQKYHDCVSKFSGKFKKLVLKQSRIKKHSDMAKSISDKTRGMVNPLHIMSLLYSQDADLCKKREGSAAISSSYEEEFAGSYHIKFDNRLAVFSLMFDVDLPRTTIQNSLKLDEFYTICDTLFDSIVSLLAVLRMFTMGTRFNVDAYRKGEIYDDVSKLRLYAYWSTATKLQDDPMSNTFLTKLPSDLSTLTQEEADAIRALDKRLSTKSMRIVITLPPNYMFANVKAFASYKQVLTLLLQGTPANGIAYRLTNGGLAEMFDFQIYNNQCRMPHSPKMDGSEQFKHMFVIPSVVHATDPTAIYDMMIRGMFDKTMGLVHADPFPCDLDLSRGLVIQSCILDQSFVSGGYPSNDNGDSHGGQLRSRVTIDEISSYIARLENRIVEKCRVRNKNVGDFEEALNLVVKEILIATVSRLDKGTAEIRGVYPSEKVVNQFLRGCYISKHPQQRGKHHLVLAVSQSKIASARSHTVGKFPKCIFRDHNSPGNVLVQLHVNRQLSFTLKYYCFKSACKGSNTSLQVKFCFNLEE